MVKRSIVLLLGFISLLAARNSRAVILFGTGNPSANTTEPTGSMAGSGWQYQGQWGAFLGTAIAPNLFITAQHVGGSIGSAFVIDGTPFETIAFYDDPGSDLRIWRVCGTLPRFASIFTGSNEAGKSLVVFGRGTQRGEEVTVGGIFGSESKGWRWGDIDGVMRWGQNSVASIADSTLVGRAGQYLKVTFDANAGANEAHLSIGDSGGAVFIQENGTWKLAGINYAIEGPYNTSPSGAGFYAALYDTGGLYQGGEGAWVLTPDLPRDVPSGFYATRVSSQMAWIQGVIAQAAAAVSLTLEGASTVNGSYSVEAAAAVDSKAKTITLPKPAFTRFFRLSSCEAVRISGIAKSGGNLVLKFE